MPKEGHPVSSTEKDFLICSSVSWPFHHAIYHDFPFCQCFCGGDETSMSNALKPSTELTRSKIGRGQGRRKSSTKPHAPFLKVLQLLQIM